MCFYQNVVESPNKEEETNSSNSGAESSLSPVTPPSCQKDLMELDIVDSETRKSPQKWSVSGLLAASFFSEKSFKIHLVVGPVV